MATLVLGAHSDDDVLGCGGIMAKLAEEGEEVVSVIYSAGEKSPPWDFNKKRLIKVRMNEALRAHDILSVKKTIFFKEEDMRVGENLKSLVRKTSRLFKRYKPTRIFVHHAQDLHVDHCAVYKICMASLDSLNYKPEIFGYEVNSWSTLFLKESQVISKISSRQYQKKLKALSCFSSQKYLLLLLKPLLVLKAFYYGATYGFKYGEQFYRY